MVCAGADRAGEDAGVGGEELEQHRGQPLEAAGGGQRVQSRQHGELCKVIFLGRDFSIRNQCMAEVKISYLLEEVGGIS